MGNCIASCVVGLSVVITVTSHERHGLSNNGQTTVYSAGRLGWHQRISKASHHCPDSEVNGANMGPTWVLSAPDGTHDGPMNLAIRVTLHKENTVVIDGIPSQGASGAESVSMPWHHGDITQHTRSRYATRSNIIWLHFCAIRIKLQLSLDTP